MNSQHWFVVKVCFGGLAALAGLLSAFFAFWSAATTPDEQSQLRRRLRLIWRKVSDAKLHVLPETAVEWLLRSRQWIDDLFTIRKDNWPKLAWVVRISFWSTLALPLAIMRITNFNPTPIQGIVGCLVVLVFMLIVKLKETSERRGHTAAAGRLIVIEWTIVYVAACAIAVVVISQMISNPSLGKSVLLGVVLAPCGVVLIGPIIFLVKICQLWIVRKTNRSGETTGLSLLFGIAITVSFSVTMIAFLVGHWLNPTEAIPRTAQMLIANVLFDGLTLVVTFEILRKTFPPGKTIALSVAIALDLIACGTLAVASLWLGLWNSQYEVTLGQAFGVLVGLGPKGDTWNFGPYFWAMHTTYIPTVVYLLFIGLAIVAKGVAEAASKMLARGSKEGVNPLALTSALFAFLLAFFGAISVGAGLAEESLTRVDTEPQARVSTARSADVVEVIRERRAAKMPGEAERQ